MYTETTIVSYLTARASGDPIVAGRQALTREWWENRRKVFDLVVSELVFQEAEAGNPEAAKRRMAFLSAMGSLAITEEAVLLGEALIEEGPIPKEHGEDALHIALCAVNGIDFLLTWNCRHLANAIFRHQIESIVEMRGYQCPVICTPEELMEE
ncbi:MAG: type II toxin-antitoxin system VapC family toxin [Deltaproteobacteria bacterium]|nr:type II toxin-antitoxin system VapC family toxin [Deltaproteobacteria bacterium]